MHSQERGWPLNPPILRPHDLGALSFLERATGAPPLTPISKAEQKGEEGKTVNLGWGSPPPSTRNLEP